MSETFSRYRDDREAAVADNADAIRHQQEYYAGPAYQEQTVILAPCVLTDEQFDWLKNHARTASPGPWGPDITLMQWAMDELNKRMSEVAQ